MSTIIALSTPNGRGALAVIRLSGSQSLSITQLLAGELHNVKPRSAALAWVRLDTGEMLDEVLITYFKGPNSVTGEDVVEISCHGSPTIVRRIIDLGLRHGARLAGPGEFSLRALSNGKINLAQAEAIRDLIAAQTEAAAKQAARQVGGELSTILGSYKKELIEAIVVLESALEFVEDDLPAAQFDSIEDTVRNVRDGIEQLSRSYSAGRLLQDGARVAINYAQRRDGAESLASEIRNSGGIAMICQADVSNSHQVTSMIERTAADGNRRATRTRRSHAGHPSSPTPTPRCRCPGAKPRAGPLRGRCAARRRGHRDGRGPSRHSDACLLGSRRREASVSPPRWCRLESR
jgi:hypothetical protein